MSRWVFDIETDGLLPDLTKIHCIAARNLDDETDVVSFKPDEIEQGLAFLSEAKFLTGHNLINFDLPAIQKIYPSFTTNGIEIKDTLVLSRLIKADLKNEDFSQAWVTTASDMPKRLYGSHSLEAWGYRLGVNKGDFGKMTDWSEWSKEMHEYMVQDTLVNHRLWYALAPETWSQHSVEFEHEIAEICNGVGNAGWQFDIKKAGELYATLAKEKTELAGELKQLFPAWTIEEEFVPKVNNSKLGYVKGEPFIKTRTIEFNPNSRKHIEYCLRQKYNWQPREYTASGDAKVDESTLVSLPFPESQKLARSFMISKRLAQLAEGRNAWLKLVDTDGKLRHSINSNGAVSGRATHMNPNMSQVPSVRAAFGKECRELFGVPHGYSLVGSDLSGLELRCLAHFMQDGGAYAKEILEGDIHTSNMKSMGLSERSAAKTAIYCLIYGGGDTRLGEAIGGSAAEGRALRQRFMKAQPAYAGLVAAVKAAVKDKGYLVGLDGRHLPIRSDHAALNTLLQSAGALICKKWMQLIKQEITRLGIDAQILCWSHDELQIQVKKGAEEDVCRVSRRMAAEAGRYFKIKIPIEAEARVGSNWAGTH